MRTDINAQSTDIPFTNIMSKVFLTLPGIVTDFPGFIFTERFTSKGIHRTYVHTISTMPTFQG